jgi:ABC-type glycerol-3-phosphate transport system permease component
VAFGSVRAVCRCSCHGALLNAPSRASPSSGPRDDAHNFNFVFFELSATKLAMKNTFLLGAMAATCGTALALVIAYLSARAAIAGHRTLAFLATAPIAIPGIVLGFGLFLAYTRGPVVLYGTLWILLLAYVTIELPAAFQQLRASFHAVSPELEEASRILGATRLRTLRDVTAPLLGPSLIATWCFIFVAVVRELSAAVILFTSETKVSRCSSSTSRRAAISPPSPSSASPCWSSPPPSSSPPTGSPASLVCACAPTEIHSLRARPTRAISRADAARTAEDSP